MNFTAFKSILFNFGIPFLVACKVKAGEAVEIVVYIAFAVYLPFNEKHTMFGVEERNFAKFFVGACLADKSAFGNNLVLCNIGKLVGTLFVLACVIGSNELTYPVVQLGAHKCKRLL